MRLEIIDTTLDLPLGVLLQFIQQRVVYVLKNQMESLFPLEHFNEVY